MSDGHEIGGKYREDPINSWKTKGRSRSLAQKKAGRDGGFTPTEQRRKDELMRQFIRRGKGTGDGNSAAFKAGYELIDWSK